MNARNVSTALATLAGAITLLLPMAGHAGNVGYYGSCWGGDKTGPIIAAGHTPVAVASISPATLSGLNALIVESCGGYSQNADIDAAVANGMSLIVNDWGPGANTGSRLPGAPALSFSYAPGSDIDLAAGTPIATGPGGTLDNTSLDGGNSSNHGYTMSALPVYVIPLLTTANASQVVAVSYPHGAGRVSYNAMPIDAYLAGASFANYPNGPGTRTYLTNLLAWSGGTTSTTCASEGYTGTKLYYCK